MNIELIKSLKPIGDGTFDKEPFEEYMKRAAILLPNFPECALENWIYRHYADIRREKHLLCRLQRTA